MKKTAMLIGILCALSCTSAKGQTTELNSGKSFGYKVELKEPPLFRWVSDEKLNDQPLFDYFILIKAKLNGYYDFGQLPTSDVFNVGKINVWGKDASPTLGMDLYQSQIRFRGERHTSLGTFTGYFEFDAWGGNNHMRLRHMWVRLSFFQFGQDWSSFADKNVWPNVFDWDGPPSGVWRRAPELKFFMGDESDLHYEIAISQPDASISFASDIDSLAKRDNQSIPDFIGAINKQTSRGHFRLTAIYRNLLYKSGTSPKRVHGYGAAVSGLIKTHREKENPIQFQLAAGKGIATYLVSFGGLNYDAAIDGTGDVKSIPAFGGWGSYEHWFDEKWHANVVGGFTVFNTDKIKSYTIPGSGYSAINSSLDLGHFYGLLNVMYDPVPYMSLGFEFNYGKKSTLHEGTLYKTDNAAQTITRLDKSRNAGRISFGAFFSF